MKTIEKREQAINLLQRFGQFTDRFGLSSQSQKAALYLNQLRANRFSVAFVGKIKVGKSSLLNALLEEELFPVGPVPLTPAITTYVRDEDHTKIIWTEYNSDSRVLLDETQPNAPAIYNTLTDQFRALNAKYAAQLNISLSDSQAVEKYVGELPLVTVDVRYPLGHSMEGLVLVDTPGTGDLSKMRMDVLHDFLPKADVAIVVLASNSPLGDEEFRFIREKLWDAGIRNLFFVLNKFDSLTRSEKEETRTYMTDVLEKCIGQRPKLYPLSAYLAIRGMQWQKSPEQWSEVVDEDLHMSLYSSPEQLLRESMVDNFRKDLWEYLDSTDRLNEQIDETLDKMAVELTCVDRAIKQTETFLKGEGEGDLSDMVRELQKTREKAKNAEQAMGVLDKGEKEVRKYVNDVKTTQILEVPVFGGNLDADHHFNQMLASLNTHIKEMNFNELVKEVGGGKRRIQIMVQDEFNQYWTKKREEMKRTLVGYEKDVQLIVRENVGAAILNVEEVLGKKLSISNSFEIAPPSDVAQKPTSLLQIGGTLAGFLLAFALAPIAWPVIGWFVAGGAGAAGGWLMGKRGDQSLDKGYLSGEVSKTLRSEIKKTSDVHLEQIRAGLDELSDYACTQIQVKRLEIKKELLRLQEEGEHAEETVRVKREWLSAVRPEFERVASDWKSLTGKDVQVSG